MSLGDQFLDLEQEEEEDEDEMMLSDLALRASGQHPLHDDHFLYYGGEQQGVPSGSQSLYDYSHHPSTSSAPHQEISPADANHYHEYVPETLMDTTQTVMYDPGMRIMDTQSSQQLAHAPPPPQSRFFTPAGTTADGRILFVETHLVPQMPPLVESGGAHHPIHIQQPAINHFPLQHEQVMRGRQAGLGLHGDMVGEHAYSQPLRHFDGPVPRLTQPPADTASYDEDTVYQIHNGRPLEVNVSVSDSAVLKRTQTAKTTVASSNHKMTSSAAKPPVSNKEKTQLASSSSAASEAAIQRIATDAGWKQMNCWLKAAEGNKKQLQNLLIQCRKAEVTVALLSSNDTPKFVRKLSKSHKDQEIRQLALSIVSKWKKAVANPPPVEVGVPEKKKEKSEEPPDLYDSSAENKEEEMPGAMTRKPSEEGIALKAGTKRRTSNEGVTEETKKEKKEGPRTKARVYTAKARSTGLEGDDEGVEAKSAVPEKKKKNTATPTGKKGKESAPVVPAKKPPATINKKPSVTLSMGFMDALMQPPEPKKKAVPKKRIERVPPLSGDPSRGVIDDLLSPIEKPTTIAMEGLFADQSRAMTSTASTEHSPSPAASGAVVTETEEPDISVGKRKIRFADENGAELVQVRFFEIEEGERINVNRYSPEEMKHMEMQMERTFRQSSGSNKLSEMDEDNETEIPSVKWRFIPVDVDEPLDVTPGGQSEMRMIQLERQKHALKAFFHPDIAQDIVEEPDDDPTANANFIPIMIPLEQVEEVAEEEPQEAAEVARSPPHSQFPPPIVLASPHSAPGNSPAHYLASPQQYSASPGQGPPFGQPPDQSPSQQQPQMSEKLRALLEGLKRKGFVPGGANDTSAAEQSSPDIQQASLSSGAVNLPRSVSDPARTNVTYAQEPTYGVPPPRVHQIAQHFVPPAGGVPPMPPNHPPGPPPGHGGPPMHLPPPSGDSIQLISGIDVHAPSFPGVGGPPPGGHSHPPHRPPNQKPCSFYNSPKGCKFGTRCGFAHVIVDGPVPGPPNWVNHGPPTGTGGNCTGNAPPHNQFRGRGGGSYGPPRGGRGSHDGYGPPRGRGGGFRGRGYSGGGLREAGGGGYYRGGERERGGRDWDTRRNRWDDRRDERRRGRSRSRSRSRSPTYRRTSRRTTDSSYDADLRNQSGDERSGGDDREEHTNYMEGEEERPLELAPSAESPASPSPQAQLA